MLRYLAITGLILSGLTLGLTPAHAQDQKVIVTVNDQPITSFDIEQRINLWKLLGDRRKLDGQRKRALNEMIDDMAAIEETKRSNAAPTEKDIDAFMGDYAKGLKTDDAGLKKKLKAQGVSVAAMRQYLAGRIAFNRLVRGKYKEDFSVSESDVKARQAQYKREIDGNINKQIAKIESDPRRKPVTVYELIPIKFPADAPDGNVTKEIINSRAIEAGGYISRFKGCKTAKSAASGIFNVQVGKRVEANGAGLNKQLKNALDKVGPGKALGPIPTPTGVEVIAFCGVRKITPPKVERPKDIQYPTTDQVRGVLSQEKFDKIAAKYSGKFRKGLYIEYRDPTYSQ
jgi:peptidyl-prolyl cis-trans isomerase SurA